KGFAIGSAALATMSLIIAYVGNFTVAGTEPVLNIAAFTVVAGAIIGGALIEYFSAMLTDNTIESAKKMADDGDKMMTPEVIAGKETPDYNHMIRLAAEKALSKMLMPSLLAMFVPVIGGFLFGVQFVGGILIGATLVAIPRAIFMGNSGGSFDNAKKYVEQGLLEGYTDEESAKYRAVHKTVVNGDTVGDTRKDVVGVALDIFIKMMSTVANTLAPLFNNFTIFH
ncbi:sodium/proton-translocating pyrophosphatase, partial [Candidatus Saccharibacteria bacterium]|nr:sodium/proton-translocating pyrophosphatase [Candidatus Saccharibacteria bacterium]